MAAVYAPLPQRNSSFNNFATAVMPPAQASAITPAATNSTRNRTAEFFAIVQAAHSRASVAASGFAPPPQPPRESNPAASTFAAQAAGIARDTNSVATKLQKLTALVKKKSNFDDRPHEIQQLTGMINHDIALLNHKISELQNFVKQSRGSGSGKQLADHTNNVVMSLQSKLAVTSNTFKNVLETRTQNMKQQKDRREQFSANTGAVSKPSSSSVLYRKPMSDRTQSDPAALAVAASSPSSSRPDHVAIDMGQQTMELISQQDTYIDSRNEEIRRIDQTISQLGDIFRQLALLVEEQGEQVTRIDQNVDDVEANTAEAQRQLLKYVHSFGDNRWLMIKVFFVLIVFFVLFVVFFA